MKALTQSLKSDVALDQLELITTNCLESLDETTAAFKFLLKALFSNLPKRRFNALSLIISLFEIIPEFRHLVLDDLELILNQFTLQSQEQPFRQKALESIKAWNQKYSQTIKQIKIAYGNLVASGIDFSNDAIYFSSSRQQINASTAHASLSNKQQAALSAKNLKIQLLAGKIKDIVNRMQTCFSIIVPNVGKIGDIHHSDPFVSDGKSFSQMETIKNAGLGSANYKLQISYSLDIRNLETEENRVVFDDLRSCVKAAVKYHASACNLGADDLKFRLEYVLEQARELIKDDISILPDAIDHDDQASEDDEEDFETVANVAQSTVLNAPSPPNTHCQTKSAAITSTPRIYKAPLQAAPDNDDSPMFYETGFEHSHRGWILPTIVVPTIIAPKRVHTPPTMMREIPSQPCRVRNSRGIICQRRDYETCPIHGKIIPRDENGVALDPDIADRELGMDRLAGRTMLWEVIADDVGAGAGILTSSTAKRKIGTSVKEEISKKIALIGRRKQ